MWTPLFSLGLQQVLDFVIESSFLTLILIFSLIPCSLMITQLIILSRWCQKVASGGLIVHQISKSQADVFKWLVLGDRKSKIYFSQLWWKTKKSSKILTLERLELSINTFRQERLSFHSCLFVGWFVGRITQKLQGLYSHETWVEGIMYGSWWQI